MLLLLSLFSFWLSTIAEARDCLCQFRNEGPEKTRIKKMEHSPTRIHVKPLCSPDLFSLALKISQVFVPQVWSITLLLPSESFSLGCKDTNK